VLKDSTVSLFQLLQTWKLEDKQTLKVMKKITIQEKINAIYRNNRQLFIEQRSVA
jgi:hypothetical protein